MADRRRGGRCGRGGHLDGLLFRAGFSAGNEEETGLAEVENAADGTFGTDDECGGQAVAETLFAFWPLEDPVLSVVEASVDPDSVLS